MRLYVKPKTKGYHSAAEFLRLHGIDPVLKRDEQGSYLDATPPEYWGERRKRVFESAIERLRDSRP
jgi:hypothetical protein